MEKKRPYRFPYTLRYGIVAAVAIVVLLNLVYPRESNVISIGYGPFKQMLQAPGAHFQNVRVSPVAIRGEVTLTDRVSGLPEVAPAPPATMTFRTSRQGITDDKELYPLLDRYAPGYEAEGEKSGLVVLVEVMSYLVIIVLLVFGGVLIARRWFGMGGGPFGFGRGKHRLYKGG